MVKDCRSLRIGSHENVLKTSHKRNTVHIKTEAIKQSTTKKLKTLSHPDRMKHSGKIAADRRVDTSKSRHVKAGVEIAHWKRQRRRNTN